MVQPTLRIAVAQPSCRPYDVAANAWAHARLVERAAADVVVFPELSLTGYELDAALVEPDGAALAPLRAACRRSASAALVGAPVAGAARARHLGLLAVDGTGVRVAYRKVQLGEQELMWFDPGDAPAVVEVAGWRLGVGVCRDTGVAGQVAATAGLGMEVFVAGLAHHDHELAEQDASGVRIARSHGVPVAFASFAGPTGGGFARTAGTSTIWASDGSVLARADDCAGSSVGATLERSYR